jgi:hypothetical protein
MENKKIESLKAQISRSKKIMKDLLGEGIWGLKKEDNKFTHEEIVFLFSRIFSALGFDYVNKVRKEFPDCICYREGKEVGIEFEPVLSSFRNHIREQDLDSCQYIICWENDLETYNSMIDEIKEKHIEVIELKKIYEEQKISDRYITKVITQADINKFSQNKLKVLKAFIESGKNILTKEEISHELGISGRGLGGVLKGFTELERTKIDWIVRQRPDRKWEINLKHKKNIIKTLEEYQI